MADNSAVVRAPWYSHPARLIILCGIILVGIVIAVTAGLLLNLRDRDLAEKEQALEALTLVLAEQIDRSFQSIELVQAAVIERIQHLDIASAEDFQRKLSDFDTHQDFRNRISALPHINAIVLTDAEGKLINFSRSWPIPSVKIPDQSPAAVFRSNPYQTSFVGKPLQSPVTGSWLVSIARKITGPNGKFLGVVVGVMELQHFEKLFQSIADTPNSSTVLFHRDGTLLVRYPRQEAAIGKSFPQGAFRKLLAKSDHGTARQIGMLDGRERFISARALAHYPVALVATGTVAEALVNWKRGAIVMIVAALLIGFAIGGTILLSVWLVGKKLREQNLQRDTALHQMSQGLIMFDAAARLVVCNDRYRHMYGLPPDLAKPGCTVLDLLKYRVANGTFSGDPEKYVHDLRASIAEGKMIKYDVETGFGRIVTVVNQPTADGGWVATHEDVTDKIRTEKAIERQKLQLDAALDNMSQGLCLFDAEQRLVVCNKRYIEIYGLDDERTKPGTPFRAILGNQISHGVTSSDPECYIQDRIKKASKNKPHQITHRFNDGRYVSIVHRPTADGGWVATHEDVTEATLREESFRLLFKDNPLPMWVYALDGSRFLAINDAAISHYGYSREQFLAMTAFDIRPPEEHVRLAQFMEEPFQAQNGERIWQHQKADGTKIDVAIYSRALNYEGQAASLIAAIDITERKHAEDENRKTKNFFNTIIENVPLPIVVKAVPAVTEEASECRFTLINRAAEELFGASRDQLIGKRAHDFYTKDHADFVVRHDDEALRANHPIQVSENIIESSNKNLHTVTARKVAIRNDDGNPEYILSLMEDVTERKRAEQRIAHLAHYDTLTELHNRAAFNEYFAATLKQAAAGKEQFTILIADLDCFKEANDAFGHAVGDELLCQVARRLRAAAANVFLARIGGDEFALIVKDGPQPAGAAALASRLFEAFAADFEIEDRRLHIGLSIGGAVYPADGSDAKTLMVNADLALYRAKAETRGSALFFEPEMGAQLGDRLALQGDLRSAVARDEMLLHYQPQVRMTGETIGFEALVRWQCPKRGMVSPDAFIPIAEESGLIIPIGEWVLREACREAAAWQQPLSVAVNISPIQFQHSDLPSLVHSILLETGLAPARLELEVTEGVLINDFSRAVSILRRLKALGIAIALDDFGTGFSSLSYLHSFAFDRIKIDRTFIGDLEHNRHSMAIVRAVIGLGHSLGVPIIAEGVETEIQHALLLQEGCDAMQGYLTGRPQPIADYDKLISHLASARKNYATAG